MIPLQLFVALITIKEKEKKKKERKIEKERFLFEEENIFQ